MSAARQSSLNLGASTTALAVASGAAPAASPILADGEMGDSASKAALARLSQAVGELKARTVVPLLRRAIDRIAVEDAQGAAEAALKALEIDERSGLAWHVLAIAREKAGDFRSSIQCYESALALTADPSDIAGDLGRLAFRLNMKPIAVQLFAHYYAAHPDCAQGANNLACAMRDLHDYTGAIRVLQPAIEANPESSPLWNTLGTILSEQGDLKSALTFFDEALRFDEGLVQPHLIGVPALAGAAQAEQHGRSGKLHHRQIRGRLGRGHRQFALGQGHIDLAEIEQGVGPIIAGLGEPFVEPQGLVEEGQR